MPSNDQCNQISLDFLLVSICLLPNHKHIPNRMPGVFLCVYVPLVHKMMREYYCRISKVCIRSSQDQQGNLYTSSFNLKSFLVVVITTVYLPTFPHSHPLHSFTTTLCLLCLMMRRLGIIFYLVVSTIS